MAALSARGRKRVARGNFALPGRRYPIHDLAHARTALGRVRQFGTAAEKRAVYKAVSRKYPGLAARSRVIKTVKRRGGKVASRKQIAAAKRNLRKARAARKRKTTARKRRKR